MKSVAKFIVPDRGDKINSGIELSPGRLHRLAGRFDNPMTESTISPSPGLGIWLLKKFEVFSVANAAAGERVQKFYRREPFTVKFNN